MSIVYMKLQIAKMGGDILQHQTDEIVHGN